MASDGKVDPGSFGLHAGLENAIRNVLNITEFYPPQAEGIENGLTGGNLMLSIPTASGKSAVAYVCICLLYTSPSPRDQSGSRMPSSA